MPPIVTNTIHTYLPRLFKGCHFCYFLAAGSGMHGVYSMVALAIVAIVTIGFVFHVELE